MLYDVKLVGFNADEIIMIDLCIRVLNYSASQAYDCVDNMPATLASQVDINRANEIKAAFEQEGAIIEVSQCSQDNNSHSSNNMAPNADIMNLTYNPYQNEINNDNNIYQNQYNMPDNSTIYSQQPNVDINIYNKQDFENNNQNMYDNQIYSSNANYQENKDFFANYNMEKEETNNMDLGIDSNNLNFDIDNNTVDILKKYDEIDKEIIDEVKEKRNLKYGRRNTDFNPQDTNYGRRSTDINPVLYNELSNISKDSIGNEDLFENEIREIGDVSVNDDKLNTSSRCVDNKTDSLYNNISNGEASVYRSLDTSNSLDNMYNTTSSTDTSSIYKKLAGSSYSSVYTNTDTSNVYHENNETSTSSIYGGLRSSNNNNDYFSNFKKEEKKEEKKLIEFDDLEPIDQTISNTNVSKKQEVQYSSTNLENNNTEKMEQSPYEDSTFNFTQQQYYGTIDREKKIDDLCDLSGIKREKRKVEPAKTNYEKAQLMCPRCASTFITTKKGQGLFGANKVKHICEACKHKF